MVWLMERQRASPFKFKVVDIYILKMNDINLVLKLVKLLYNIHSLFKIHNKIWYNIKRNVSTHQHYFSHTHHIITLPAQNNHY